MMRFTSPTDLGDTITTLRKDEDMAGEDALDMLEQSQEILEGFVLAAKRLGLSDVYGIMRGNVADDKSDENLVQERVDPAPIFTHAVPFERFAEAYEMASTYKDGVIKTVLTFENQSALCAPCEAEEEEAAATVEAANGHDSKRAKVMA